MEIQLQVSEQELSIFPEYITSVEELSGLEQSVHISQATTSAKTDLLSKTDSTKTHEIVDTSTCFEQETVATVNNPTLHNNTSDTLSAEKEKPETRQDSGFWCSKAIKDKEASIHSVNNRNKKARRKRGRGRRRNRPLPIPSLCELKNPEVHILGEPHDSVDSASFRIVSFDDTACKLYIARIRH